MITISPIEQAICRTCTSPLHPLTLNFGSLPLSNRFLVDPEERQYTHPLTLGVCRFCGLTQIVNPPPISEVAPRFPWIVYNEPEGHLDQLADLIAMVHGNMRGGTAGGVSYKDDSTLERLHRRGVGHTWRVTAQDLGLDAPRVEIETVQDRFTPDRVETVARTRGQADILLVRHVLEHVHDVHTFLESLKLLMKPDGVLIFEVPDCSAVLAQKDYSTVWEEHVLYFTPETLQRCLESHGFEVMCREIYPYPLENSLIVFARRGGIKKEQRRKNGDESNGDVALALAYFDAFLLEKEFYRKCLSEYRGRGDKVVLLGAGHLACAFVNLFELQEYIECVLDDDPNRQGLFMPGSRLPIRPSSTLNDYEVRLCLLSLNPMNEERVIARFENFLHHGGEFRSIFPASRYALRGNR